MPFITQGKTNWKSLLIVVILATIAGGGIFYQWRTLKEEIKIPEVELPEKVTEDETADWQIYKNEEYGYEIKYPEDWEGDFSDSSYISLSNEISAESFTDFSIEVYKSYYGSQGPMFVSCAEPEESEISGINGIKYYCNVPYWRGTEYEKPPISEIISHVIISELCVDENFIPQDYDLEKCGESGIYNNYFKFVLDCEGEEWIGELGKDNCNQLFNQILSTFRFIGRYGISGESEWETMVSGYLETKVEEVIQTDSTITVPYFVITKFYDEQLKESIEEKISIGNTVNIKEDGMYKFNLGCLEGEKIVGMEYDNDEAYIDEETMQKILSSSKENTVTIVLSFGRHLGMGCICCNLAHKVRIYEE